MMLPQQETGITTPEGPSAANPKNSKQKGGPINGGGTLAAPASAEHQAQRCPRCDSLNTKFCYYNNYSLSQPRHFCKNCRRYWTKGGALRNVPVGGGCRKNKRLKHRDPSCLSALADVDVSASSNLFSSMGIPGFGPSTSSLIHELASEGQRLAFSQLGMPTLDKRFSTDNGHHHHHHHPPTATTQEFFAAPSLMGSFDHPASFPALSYTKGDPQSLLFQPHHGSELTPFFDPITSPTALTPSLESLSSFTTAGMAMNCATPLSNTSNMDAAQLGFMHHMPMNGLQASHDHQEAMQENGGGGNVVNHEREINPNMQDDMRISSRGKSFLSSLSDRGQQITGAAPNLNAADSCFYPSPQVGSTGNDPNGFWSASWPEMHAALAGSAGAMLH